MNIEELLEAIEGMTILELNELVEEAEERFGVSAAPVAVAGAAVAGDGADAGGAEKSDFDVVIENAGSKKIAVIKVVREITGLGLKESKEIVDNAPGTVKEAVPAEEAEKMKADLEEAGATVELK